MSKVGRLLLRHLMRLHPMKIKEIPVHTSNDFIIDSKVNVTFHELFKMNDKQFSKWKKDLQKIVYQSWVEYGEPPNLTFYENQSEHYGSPLLSSQCGQLSACPLAKRTPKKRVVSAYEKRWAHKVYDKNSKLKI
jgi:hypothetical protein